MRIEISAPTTLSMLFQGLDSDASQAGAVAMAAEGEDSTIYTDVALDGPVGDWIREHAAAGFEFDDAEVQRHMSTAATLARGGKKQTLGFKVGLWLGRFRVEMSTCRVPSLNASIFSMDDSTEYVFDNPVEMFRRFERDGYLLLRGLVDKAKVERARRVVAAVAAEQWGKVLVDMSEVRPAGTKHEKKKVRGTANSYDVQVELPSGEGWLSGQQHDRTREEEELAAWLRAGRSHEAQDVLEASEIRKAFDALCEGASATWGVPLRHRLATNCAWLRVRGTGVQSPEAADFFHMRRHVPEPFVWDEAVAREHPCAACHKSRLSSAGLKKQCPLCPNPAWAVACWAPLGPWPVDGGSIALLPGSHRFSGFSKSKADVPVGFNNQAAGQAWVVGALDPGDVLIMDAQLVTATTENRRPGYFRASLDKRVVIATR